MTIVFANWNEFNAGINFLLWYTPFSFISLHSLAHFSVSCNIIDRILLIFLFRIFLCSTFLWFVAMCALSLLLYCVLNVWLGLEVINLSSFSHYRCYNCHGYLIYLLHFWTMYSGWRSIFKQNNCRISITVLSVSVTQCFFFYKCFSFWNPFTHRRMSLYIVY